MRRISLLLVLGAAIAAGCGEDGTSAVANPNNYLIVAPPNNSVSVRQDLVIDLRDSGLVIVRNGADTLPGDPNDTTRNNPRLSFYVENSDIAIISPYGVLRGIKPGSTTIRAVGFDQEMVFNVTVNPYLGTTVRLSVASGPAGGLLLGVNKGLDTGTFFALPADRLSSILEGLITVDKGAGVLDTVFCNRCGAKAFPNRRVMRLVNFKSLNPALATISNAANPFAQRTSTSSNADLANVDTTGRVTAFDTSSTPVGFVMEVPGDGVADTVYVKFKLRPLDTLRIRPDSADFPPNSIDQIGTQRRIYPNSDTLQGNFVQSATTNFAVGVDYLANVRRLPNAPSTSQQGITRLVVRSSGGVTTFRPNMPIVTWESALRQYLQLVPNGAWLANVSGACAFISTTCFAPSSSSARNALVLTCADSTAKLPGFNSNGTIAGIFPLAFGGDGTYSIPSCSPAKVIPMPGAFCTTASSTDLSSQCTVWVRATATDPATGKIISDRYRINVRR